MEKTTTQQTNTSAPKPRTPGFKPQGDRPFKRDGAPSKSGDRKPREGGRDSKKFSSAKPKEFKEKLIAINRVSKTTKGGRTMRFTALVVIGNGKGRVGFGTGKSLEIPDAIRKAINSANKRLVDVNINKHGTLSHEVIGRHGASKVLLKPAPDGTGIVAGGPIRAVMELAGYTNIYSKNLGASSSINMVRATIEGLSRVYTPKMIASLRGKELSEL